MTGPYFILIKTLPKLTFNYTFEKKVFLCFGIPTSGLSPKTLSISYPNFGEQNFSVDKIFQAS